MATKKPKPAAKRKAKRLALKLKIGSGETSHSDRMMGRAHIVKKNSAAK